MMGGHHAASGAAAWVAIASTGPYALGWYPLDATGIVIGAMATAGTALVCDWDHRSSTMAHSLPPLSNVIAVGIENASGGHRQGTHSVLGAAFFVLLATMAGQIQLQTRWGLLSVGAGLLCMFMINIAAKALKLFPKSGWISNWIFALVMAGLVTWFAPHQWTWLPVSMLTGVLVHIVGDMITTGGVPLLWPLVIKPPKVLREAAAAQERLAGQRGVLHPAAGPGRVAAGVAGPDPGQRLRDGGDVWRGRPGRGQGALPRRRWRWPAGWSAAVRAAP